MATIPEMRISAFIFLNQRCSAALVVYRYSDGTCSAERLSKSDGEFKSIEWKAYNGCFGTILPSGRAEMNDEQFARFIDLLNASGWCQVFPKPAT